MHPTERYSYSRHAPQDGGLQPPDSAALCAPAGDGGAELFDQADAGGKGMLDAIDLAGLVKTLGYEVRVLEPSTF